MQCPRCFKEDVSAVGDTHYVCNNPDCVDDSGNRTQFRVVNDDKVHFPYNQIFVSRGVHEFYRKPYLKLGSIGVTSTTK